MSAAAAIAAALLLSAGGALGYAPGPIAPASWVVSGGGPNLGGGTVNSIATSGSTAYLGGNFSYIGPPTGSGASLDAGTGALAPAWPAITGIVRAIAADGSGGWFVGGTFSSIGTAHYDNLVHIKSDGTIDANWTASTDGPVFSLLVVGQTVFAGGAFTHAKATARSGLAGFDKTTGSVTTFSADVSGGLATVSTMAVSPFGNTTLYIGGSFSQVGSTARNNLAAITVSSGGVTNWNPNVNGRVFAVAVDDSGTKVFAGGLFTVVNQGPGSAGRNSVAEFDNSTGIVDTNWQPNPNGNVYAIAVSGQAAGATIYLGGSFKSIGGQARNFLAAVSGQGAVTAWNPNLDSNPQVCCAIFQLEVAGGNVYAGGFFPSIGGTARDNLAVVNASTGALSSSFAPVVGGTVWAIGVNTGTSKVAVGGEFRSVGDGTGQPGDDPVRRNNLGAIDLTTGRPTIWAPATDNTVNAVAISGPAVYVGGAFDNVTGATQHAAAAFDASSGQTLDWNPEIENGVVDAIAVSGSTIYAGGSFTLLDADCSGNLDVERDAIAAFDEDGCPTSWSPSVSDEVKAIAVTGGTVYAGGRFTSVNGVERHHLAGIDVGSGLTTSFNPDVNGDVDALAASGSTLYAGGSFSLVNGGTARAGAAALTLPSTGPGEFGVGDATAWDPHLAKLGGAPLAVNALAVAGQTVYVGGDFDTIGPCPVCQQGSTAAVTATTGAVLPSWLPEPNGTVDALALGRDGVMIGGLFSAVGYPRPGAPFLATEPAATASGGFAAVHGLPEPPANVSASPRDGGATITFAASPFDGGSAITQYKVTINGTQTVTGTSSPIQVDGLTNGTAYSLAVTAINGVGEGASSPTITVTPNPAPTAPGAPTNVTATPGDGKVTINFTPPSDGGSPITSYQVTAQPGGITASGPPSGIDVTGLTNGQAYTFTVTATNAIGTGPASNPPVLATPRTVPGAPTNVTAMAGNTQATVSFSPAPDGGSPIIGYTVTSSPGGRTATGSGTQLTVTGLQNGTAYTFTVTATNAAGTGPASLPSSPVTPRTVPQAPTNISATAGNSSATVSFTPPTDDGGEPPHSYTVTASPGGQTATGQGSPIPIGGLTNGVSYTFTVVATNGAGDSAPSVSSNAVTPIAVPGAPTNVLVTPGNGQVTVNYTPPASNGGSPITLYTAVSAPGNFQATSANGDPIVVTGLTNGVSYVFTVTASNAAGVGPASSSSAPVTPRTVPGAPTGVGATPGNGQATVTFTPPASDGGSPITGYTVTSSPGNFTGTGTQSPITVSGLLNGVSYTFTVRATNAAGDGAPSAASNAVTPDAGPTPPLPPTGVSATAGDGQATVSFTPPASNGGATITGYTVTSSPGNITATGAGSPITVSGLTNGTAYTFTVKATNSAGTSVPSSVSNQVTPASVTTAPGAPTGVAATAGNGQATVTFTPPASDGGSAITSYTVTSSPGNKTASGAGSPLTVTGLTNGQAYTFTVTASNGIGTGVPSAPSNSVTPGFAALAPGAPTGVSATAGNGIAVVTFTPPVVDGGAPITSYTVTVSPGGKTVSGASSPIVVTGLSNGIAYTVTVTATNTAGTGAASAPPAAVTPSARARTAAPNPPPPQPRPAVPEVPPQSSPRVPPPQQ